MHVLAIATDSGLLRRIVTVLAQRGHQIEHVAEPSRAIPLLRGGSYHLLLVGEALGEDAASLCAQLTAARSGPVPFLTVWTERVEIDHLEALLAAGADDCLLTSLDDAALLPRLLVNEHWARTAVPAPRPEACQRAAPLACCPVLQEMPAGLFRVTAAGRLLEVNQTLARLLGYAGTEELLAADWNNRCGDPAMWQALLRVPYDSITDVEVAWKCQNGSSLHLQVSGRILRDERGRPLVLEGIAEDASPRKQAEAAFRDEVARTQHILENSLDGLVICDLTGRLREVNSRFCELSGYSRPELLSMTIPDLTAEMSAAEVAFTLQQFARHGSGHFCARLRQKQNDILDLEVHTRVGRFGQRELLFISVRDLTAHKQAQARLRESENRYRLIAENVSDTIWTARFPEPVQLPPQTSDAEVLALAQRLLAEVQFTYISPSVHRLLGYTPEEFLQIRLPQIVVPDSLPVNAQRLAEGLLRERDRPSDAAWRVTVDICHRTKQGELRWAEVAFTFLHNSQGQIETLLGVTRDVTQRRQAEAALQQEQEHLRQLLELHERDRKALALELHDELAQQLTGAMMTLEAGWQMRASQPTRAEEQFQRGTGLVRQVIDYSRRLVTGLRPPCLDEFGLAPAIEHLVSQQQTASGLELEFVSKGPCRRLAPPLESALFRIVQETLNNALRHSQSRRLRVELACNASKVWVSVRDWGVGFDPQQLPPGARGLEAVREWARLFGGQAVFCTSAGQGTEVSVQLPLILPAGPASLATTTLTPAPSENLREPASEES